MRGLSAAIQNFLYRLANAARYPYGCAPGVPFPARSASIKNMPGVDISGFNLENLRERLQRMSDKELIRFGKAASSLLTPQANLGRPPREVFVIQLQEARNEWRRRYPKESK